MADYCTPREVKARMPEITFNSTFDATLTGLVTACSRLIDREVGRPPNFFYPSTSDETRYFDGSGTIQQCIDEAVSITSVSVSESGGLSSSDYTLWSSTDYITWPYNTTPIMRLDVDILNGSKVYWDRYPKSVKVVGIFGYAATIPADVKQACIIQVTRWLMRGKQGWADNGASPEFGQIIINTTGTGKASNLDPDVAAILWHYKIGNMGYP